jgi:UDP-N-acetylglucosamine:LPS N-acetylglucosamine transferase
VHFVSIRLYTVKDLVPSLLLIRPGQEEGNIPFVENAAFGYYNPHPLEIAKTVSRWLSSPDELKAMQQAARSAARPNATLDIAKDIAEILIHTQSAHKNSRNL